MNPNTEHHSPHIVAAHCSRESVTVDWSDQSFDKIDLKPNMGQIDRIAHLSPSEVFIAYKDGTYGTELVRNVNPNPYPNGRYSGTQHVAG
jgi:hypothetical protein